MSDYPRTLVTTDDYDLAVAATAALVRLGYHAHVELNRGGKALWRVVSEAEPRFAPVRFFAERDSLELSLAA